MTATLTPQNLRNFLIKLYKDYSVLKEKYKEEFKRTVPDFNLFSLGRKIVEPFITEQIYFFLEPQEKHEHEDLFLKLFLETLDELTEINLSEEIQDLEDVSVFKEHTISAGAYSGRIDLWIEGEDFVIGIENKLTTGEGKAQLKRYYEILKQRGRKYLLVFLTKEEDQDIKTLPKELQETEHFEHLSYEELLTPWLEKCGENSQSEKLKFYIRDFNQWIKQ